MLAPALRRLSPENAQGEYYLSDVVEVLADAGYTVGSLVAEDAVETAGVNDRAQLATAEAELRDRTNERWMRRGVTMVDPERTYVDASVELAPDVTLFRGDHPAGRDDGRHRRRDRPGRPADRHRRGRAGRGRVHRGPPGHRWARRQGRAVRYPRPGGERTAGTVTGPHYEG